MIQGIRSFIHSIVDMMTTPNIAYAPFTDGLAFWGAVTVEAARQRLHDTWQALSWWQKLTHATQYRWRYECLWLLSRGLKQGEGEAPGADQHLFGPQIDWITLLDTMAQGIVPDWNTLSWWKRTRYASRALIWLTYLQELREDAVRRRNEAAAEVERRYPNTTQY
jgi:hypothetical protein